MIMENLGTYLSNDRELLTRREKDIYKDNKRKSENKKVKVYRKVKGKIHMGGWKFEFRTIV